ncbi:hypothetical protein FOC1_g10013374 [Fusarium oxysporum f. sp. cubense race 1]|uniref:Uncharacterized protein n=1 Tax=Fusarium oxysporum f. sp. cubense (strain race 1) TaxID=1229664 RepID=N4URH2_FUSC1|nr:hypothetical protein FOC1_g10013374 [Fusarium oxysporum f. sp. cubense race 1]
MLCHVACGIVGDGVFDRGDSPSDDTRASRALILLDNGEADGRLPVGLGLGAARVMRYDRCWLRPGVEIL